MKSYFLLAVFLAALIIPFGMVKAQTALTSAQLIEDILSEAAHREEFTRLNSGITTVLADQRLTDQSTREMLQQSQTVLNEMLNQKVGSNVEKLVEFAKWMSAQSLEQISIHDAGGATSPQQQFVLDNPLAGGEVYLASIIDWILSNYTRIDGAGIGDAKLESYLQLYLSFRSIVEGGTGIPECLLLRAPAWIQARFPQLTDDQKRQFLKDSNEARAERDLEPLPGEVPAPPPTPQEEAAYEAAYQFILSNTPQP